MLLFPLCCQTLTPGDKPRFLLLFHLCHPWISANPARHQNFCSQFVATDFEMCRSGMHLEITYSIHLKTIHQCQTQITDGGISMEKYIYDKNNGLWYELHGDYYLPCLVVTPMEKQTIGAWAESTSSTSRNIVLCSIPSLF